MGIKSALILNYSRDKNPHPKRSVGDSASPLFLLMTFKRIESGVSETTVLASSTYSCSGSFKEQYFSPFIYLQLFLDSGCSRLESAASFLPSGFISEGITGVCGSG